MNIMSKIGFEIQCEIKTKTKMFSGAKVGTSNPANTTVNEIDMAMPGTLPSVNKRGVEQAIKACHLLNMDISPVLRFDRKCYFYPDLAKGFQITQEECPIGTNGHIEIKDKQIKLNKLIIEEDVAELIDRDDYSLIDYNRSGNPLLKIVCESAEYSVSEVVSCISALKEKLLAAGITNPELEKDSLRCNVVLLLQGDNGVKSKIEINKLDSLVNVEKALNYELERQNDLLASEKSLVYEIREYDQITEKTTSINSKNEEIDYRIHSEPNILVTVIEQSSIEKAKAELS